MSTQRTRLARLEAIEAQRVERIQTRALAQLTDGELDAFIAYFNRWDVDPLAEPTPAQRQALCRVETLLQADPEACPGHYLHVPAQWFEQVRHGE